MAGTAISRTVWVDDDGSGTTGTVLSNSTLQAIYDKIDLLFTSGTTGAHTLAIQNTTAGAGAYTAMLVGTDAQTTSGLYALSSTYTTAGASVQNGMNLTSVNAGGLSLTAQHASGELRFYSGGTAERARISAAGNLGLGVTPLANYRCYIKGENTTVGTYALLLQNSAAGTLLLVHNDGTINTGLAAASPYNNTSAIPVNMYVHTDGILYRSTSSARYKDQIEPFDGGLEALLALQPVTFVSKHNPSHGRFIGFTAEDVCEVAPYLVSYRVDSGAPESVHYDRLTAYLVNAVKTLTARLQALEAN